MRAWRIGGVGIWALFVAFLLAGCGQSLPGIPPVPPPPSDSQPTERTPIAAAPGLPSATLEQARNWAVSRGAATDFVVVAAIYWRLAPELGIRPEVAYAQSAKETGFGHFSGVVPRSYHNWCGLKTRAGGSDDDPSAHAQFASDEEGITAHLQHLAAYAGLPVSPPIVDPRYVWVPKGSVKYVEDLGGKWAPSPDYGQSIVRDYLNDLLRAGRSSSFGWVWPR